jgi:hypothetical protein
MISGDRQQTWHDFVQLKANKVQMVTIDSEQGMIGPRLKTNKA